MMKTRISLVALAMVMGSSEADAGTIFSTDFSSATQAGGVGTAITMGGATNGVTVSTLTAGAGVLAFQIDSTSLAGQTAAPVFASASVGINPSSNLTQAVANNEYFQFTASSTNALNYDSFSFDMVKHGFANFAGITLRSSADNYASDLVTVANSAAQGVYPASVDLSANTSFDNLSSVTFRLYLYDEYSGNNNRHLGVDNIQIQIAGGSVSGRPGLTIRAGSGTVTIGATNLSAVAGNTLQFKPYLTYSSWSNLSSVTGVTATNWILSPTNKGFFRVESTNNLIFAVDTYYNAADGPDRGPSIRRAVAAAQAFTAQSETNFAQVWFTSNATYQLEARTNDASQIELFQAERIQLIGNNAQLNSYINDPHFSLWRCKDVVIEGFRLDLFPLPFTQGTLVGIDPATGRFDVQIDAGFADPPLGTYLGGAGANDVTFYNPAGQHLHQWLNVATGAHPAELPADTFRFFAVSNDFSALVGLVVGDRCVVKTLTDYPAGVVSEKYTPDGELISNGAGNLEIRKCENITIKNLTSYSSRSQTVHTFGCRNLVFDRSGFLPKPGSGRLLGSNKGGWILRCTLGTALITNCYFESAADDLMNASDNPFESIVLMPSNTVEITEDRYPMEQSAGWTLLIIDPQTPALKGKCRVASVEKRTGVLFRLILDQMIFEPGYSSISSNDWLYVERQAPVTVSDTAFMNSLKKGIISRGPTVVSGCTFSNLNYGIHHYYEGIASAGEGPYANGLQAASNRFVDCTTGGVVLYSAGSAPFNVAQQNIVSGNVFDQSADGEGIKAVRMNGLTIENNSFSFDPSVPADRQAIVLVSCTNTIVSGNTGDRLP